MIEPTPQWSFDAGRAVYQWYGHVRILSDRVLGQWCCLDRETGRLIWQKNFWRPNTVRGVSEGVIVASETRHDGPWIADFGCYGICLETGDLLWTSHARGWWGRVVRFLDYVPEFTNELRDSPHHVVGREVVCVSGRVLDLLSGADLRRISRAEVARYEEPHPAASHLPAGGGWNGRTKVQVGPSRWLCQKRLDEDRPAGGVQLHLLDESEAVLWEWNSRATGLRVAGDFYSCRYAPHPHGPPFVYLVASEEPNLKSDPARPHSAVWNPTRYPLLSLDVAEGRVVGDTLVDEGRASECRIEDADDRGVLVSLDRSKLKYYQRSTVSLTAGPL
jgi:hypothetical protein